MGIIVNFMYLTNEKNPKKIYIIKRRVKKQYEYFSWMFLRKLNKLINDSKSDIITKIIVQLAELYRVTKEIRA